MSWEKISFRDFFRLFYGSCEKGFFIEMRYTLSQDFSGGKIKRLWGDTKNIDEWVDGIEGALRTLPHNIHFTPAARSEPSGRKDTVALVPALWTDIDNMSRNEIKKIISELCELDMSPNLLVSSGWGTYLFWLLEHPSIDRARAENANRIAAMLSDGDMGAVNISHTLRAPGSFNCKTSVPRPVLPFLLSETRYREDVLFTRMEEYEKLFTDFKSGAADGFWRGEREKTKKTGVRESDFPPLFNPGEKGWKTIAESGTLECPILRAAIVSPEKLSYSGWMSIGAALRRVCGQTGGEEAFRSLSKLSKTKYSPEGFARGWGSICENDMKPWGCSKVTEGTSCLLSDRCKGIMSVMYKIMPRKPKAEG